MNKQLLNTFRKIAKLHGVKLILDNKTDGGMYWGAKIILGTKGTTKQLISVFCHELAHYKNDIEGKYPIYHRIKGKQAIKRMGFRSFIDYALRAEIYTDKVGRKICKDWFPTYKYEMSYKYTEYWKGFMYGYYLPEV